VVPLSLHDHRYLQLFCWCSGRGWVLQYLAHSSAVGIPPVALDWWGVVVWWRGGGVVARRCRATEAWSHTLNRAD